MRTDSDVNNTTLIERGTRCRAHATRIRTVVAYPSRKEAFSRGRKIVAPVCRHIYFVPLTGEEGRFRPAPRAHAITECKTASKYSTGGRRKIAGWAHIQLAARP